ncbi:hypothetical protein MAR_036116 [Mya arenaria]|uniref:Uncharacterized protein n=1 Tax=Mya arenaria TaxID=6604 RepID=A0ABY7EMI3_MYAAR|nr:hypothetical protein MAR_036116 [Mya arenaria]
MSFIPPISEYDDIRFDNCTQQENKTQQEAEIIRTGASKLESIFKLMKNNGRENRHYSRIVKTNAEFSTYFTDSSESIIALIFTFKETLIHSSGVADPHRDQNGDLKQHRRMAASYDRDSLCDNNVQINLLVITYSLKSSIPNRQVLI